MNRNIQLRRTQRLWFEQCECRLCLSALSFIPHEITKSEINGLQDIVSVDINGDGHLDVLYAAAGDDKIAWSQNVDGKGSFGAQRVISSKADGATSIVAGDIDGDGDLDVVSGSRDDNKIAWYENTDGSGSFGPQQTIQTIDEKVGGQVWSVAVGDLDGDGDLDVLFHSRTFSWFDHNGVSQSSSSSLGWFENNGDVGTFGPPQVISTNADGAWVSVGDLDGDGDIDVLSSQQRPWAPKSMWYANVDGAGSFGPSRAIAGLGGELSAVDLDSDGDLDVLGSNGWKENLNGAGGFGPVQGVGDAVRGLGNATAADLDGDGDLDVLGSNGWAENVDGFANFELRQRMNLEHGIASIAWVAAGDLDGDGDADTLAAITTSWGEDTIEWYENRTRLGSFREQHEITAGPSAAGAESTTMGDLDGDGDLDVLSASSVDGKIAWYKNTGGGRGFGPQQVISTGAEGAFWVTAGDVDRDGDLDVIAASTQNDWDNLCCVSKIAWFENIDGEGTFGLPQQIANSERIKSVATGDVDGDGDLDVLSSSMDGNKISWYENTDGAGTYAAPQVAITTVAKGRFSLTVGDVDGDGDLDVMSTSSRGALAWYPNTDGAGSFGPGQTINATGSAHMSSLGDVDGDGDLDLLTAGYDQIAWYTNSDGFGSFDRKEVIVTRETDGHLHGSSVTASDLDGDGDLDVLFGGRGKIAWYENTDSSGSFERQREITAEADFGNSAVASVSVGDLDGDGDLDVLSASPADHKVAWYENTDGTASFGPQQVLTTGSTGAFSVAVGDLDGDGNLDVVSASYAEPEIAWHANSDGRGFAARQVISTVASGARFVTLGDVDGDGDLDVIAESSAGDPPVEKVVWHENRDGLGRFEPEQLIATHVVDGETSFWDHIDQHRVTLADVDGDRDLDVVWAISDGEKIAWYENTDGSGSFGPEHVIAVHLEDVISVATGDFDGDGDVDVLSAESRNIPGSSTIAWYENIDGEGTYGPQLVISHDNRRSISGSVKVGDVDADGDLDVYSPNIWAENVNGAGTFQTRQDRFHWADAYRSWLGDVDGDGDLDVLSIGMSENEFSWRENTDGRGGFSDPRIIEGYSDGEWLSSLATGDMDGDNDLDIVYGSSLRVGWLENGLGPGSFGPPLEIIESEGAIAVSSVAVGDVDADGDLDVLSAGPFPQNGIAWYENTDARGSYGPKQVISANGADGLIVADINGDGNLDAFAYGQNAWYENTDGRGTFEPQQVIKLPSGEGATTLADLDGDNDLDVLFTARQANKVVWYENVDGKGALEGERLISNNAFGANDVTTGDLDGDGDLDVLAATWDDNKVTWHENIDGLGAFGPQQVITSEADDAKSLSVGDVDLDGDQDVIFVSLRDNKIVWLENESGLGGYGSQRVITNDARYASSVAVADLDADGDLDVLSASNSAIVWYENNDGEGNFSPELLVSTDVHDAESVTAGDVDGDGDLDVLFASSDDDRIAWFENRLAGDADDDGVVDFADFLALSANFAVADSSFENGDFDGDGRVDFADFLILSTNFGKSRPS